MNLITKTKQIAHALKEKAQRTFNSAKTFLVGVSAVGMAMLASPKAQAVPPDPASITTDLQGVLTSASDIFTAVVPIVIAVCALGILMYMIRLVKLK